jgi:DNA polymerase-3 subunit alpha
MTSLDILKKITQLHTDINNERIQHEFSLLEEAPEFLIEGFLKAYQAIHVDGQKPQAINECHSLIAFEIGITTSNPNAFPFHYPVEPSALPDYDIDFADNQIPKRYAIQKYGEHNVCSIGTYGTYKFKSLLKDLTRLFKGSDGERLIPLKEVHELAKKLGLKIDSTINTDDDDGSGEDEITFDNEHIQNFARKYPYVFEHFKALYGLNKYSGMHAAGILILPKPFAETVPVRKSKGTHVTEWVEGQGVSELGSMGAIKIDLLGLITLRIMNDANLLVMKRYNLSENTDSPCDCREVGRECSTNFKLPFLFRNGPDGKLIKVIDLDNLCLHIPGCYESIQDGKTTGIFQLEPRGITEFARSYGPKKFMDLALITSLYRPGAMDCHLDNNGMPIDKDLHPNEYKAAKGAHVRFVERVNGREKPTFTSPRLESVLGDSMGVSVFQEDLSRIITTMTGCTFAEAEKTRKFFTKIKPELLRTDQDTISKVNKMCDDFVSKSKANGCSEEEAIATWNMILPFARYGFNKSHAVAYSIITYQTAFFRTFYPLEHFTAILSNNIGKEQKVVEYIRAVQSSGFIITKPDCNESQVKFSIGEQNNIIAGLEMIKGVGKKGAQLIVEDREKNGPFKSIEDFLGRDILWRVVNIHVLESMTKAGCFDSICENRHLALAKILIAKGAKKKTDYEVIDIFDDDETLAKKNRKNQDIIVEDWTESEKLIKEREVFGFPFDDALTKNLGRVKVYYEAFKKTCEQNKKDAIFGIIEDIFVKQDKNGSDMAFISATDLDGNKKRWVMFGSIYGQFNKLLHKNEPYFAFGKYDLKNDSYLIDGIQTLDFFAESA